MDHRAPPPWNGKTNGFSIAAVCMAMFGCAGLLALVFAIIGLRQSRRNGDRRGRNYAIAALIILGLWVVAIAVAVTVNIAKGPDRDAAGSVRGERSISVGELRTGDCLEDIGAQVGSYVDVVPCTMTHNSEVFGAVKPTEGAAECSKLFPGYAGKTLKEVRATVLTADLEDDDVACIAYHVRDSNVSLRK